MNLSIRLNQFGNPMESITVVDTPLNEPKQHEVLLEMLAAPINPADINIIEGQYGSLPPLPSIIGNEGVGRIIRVGSSVSGFSPGQMVLPIKFGTWTQKMVLPAANIIPLPKGLDIWQAAMLTVNPATAWLMLHDFCTLAPGDWVVQNAANSGVGRSVIQLAHALGLKTLNIVRREELIPELLAIGADAVVIEATDLSKEVSALCSSRPRLGLNAVGGASALNVASALAPGGTLVTFGAMGRQALKIPNSFLIFQGLKFCGFWLARWRKTVSATAREETYAKLARYLAQGILHTPVHKIFTITEALEAVNETVKESRSGKVLLDLTK